jgi:hypothetical protein
VKIRFFYAPNVPYTGLASAFKLKEVAVEFDYRVSRIDQVRSVDLDLVVVLSAGESCSCSQGQDEEKKSDRDMSGTHRSIKATTSHEEISSYIINSMGGQMISCSSSLIRRANLHQS